MSFSQVKIYIKSLWEESKNFKEFLISSLQILIPIYLVFFIYVGIQAQEKQVFCHKFWVPLILNRIA